MKCHMVLCEYFHSLSLTCQLSSRDVAMLFLLPQQQEPTDPRYLSSLQARRPPLTPAKLWQRVQVQRPRAQLSLLGCSWDWGQGDCQGKETRGGFAMDPNPAASHSAGPSFPAIPWEACSHFCPDLGPAACLGLTGSPSSSHTLSAWS